MSIEQGHHFAIPFLFRKGVIFAQEREWVLNRGAGNYQNISRALSNLSSGSVFVVWCPPLRPSSAFISFVYIPISFWATA